MKPSEIRELSTEDVENNLDEAREELMRLRFQKATGELTDHNQMRNARVRIARLITNLNERSRNETTETEGEE